MSSDNPRLTEDQREVMRIKHRQGADATILYAERMLAQRLATVAALVPDDCWVYRSADLRCTDLVGGVLPNGATWVEDMCCLPCRLRKALE